MSDGPCSFDDREIIANGVHEAHIKRMRDERVADRYLGEVRERPKKSQILELQIVAGVHAKAQGMRGLAGPRVSCNTCRSGLGTVLERSRKRLGVELDAIGPHRVRPGDGGEVRVYEHAHPNARAFEFVDEPSDLGAR